MNIEGNSHRTVEGMRELLEGLLLELRGMGSFDCIAAASRTPISLRMTG